MEFELSQAQTEVVEWARSFTLAEILPRAVAHSKEKIAQDLLQALSREGFMTLNVPEEMGGLGLDAISYSLVIREIAKACGSVAVTVAVTNMVADVLVREGNNDQHRQFLSDIVEGRSLTASFCLTENQSGSDARSLKAQAIKNSNGYILSGEKLYVTNGAFSTVFLVMAKIEGQKNPSAFLVRKGTDGFVIGAEEDKMGLIGSSTVRIALDQVSVSLDQLLGEEGEGFKIAMRALDGGRISVASQALGIADAALSSSIRYAKDRQAFGHHLSDFQAIQWKVADMSTQLKAAESLVHYAAFLKDQKKDFTVAASQAKLLATESACKICEEAIQIHGGYGYVKDFPVERYYRDVRVTTLYEGTSEIQRLVIARHLLS